MQNDPNKNTGENDAKKLNRVLIVIFCATLLILVVGWAVATVFEVEMMKALAMVVLGAVGIVVALVMAGIT